MIKLIGAVLLVSSCGYTGWHVSGIYARRPVELRQFMTALQMLETEITYAATPLPDALAGIAERVDARIASFFAHAAGELKTNRGTSAREAWNTALNIYRTRSTLDKGDLDILSSLGRNLGISDRADQVKHLRLALEQLKMAQTRAEETASKNVKLWNYAGLLGGLIIVLALY